MNEEGSSAYWVVILEAAGFEKTGELRYGRSVELWWHSAHRLELLLYLGSPVLVKATKSYYLIAIGEAGEVYARDLSGLHDWLERHFSECHMSLSSFRDISDALAFKRTAEKRLGSGITSEADLRDEQEQLRRLRGAFAAGLQQLQDIEGYARLDAGRSSLIGSYLKPRRTGIRRELEAVKQQGRERQNSIELTMQLQKEYLKKGRATCLMFSFSSNLQVARSPDELRDALEQITKEVMDLHRYQVSQKLQGGKLQIFVEEAKDPALAWQVQWAGGVLNPRQLANLGPEFDDLAEQMNELVMVTPAENVIVGGAVKDEKKLVAARVVQNFLKRLDRIPEHAVPQEGKIPPGKVTAWVGLMMEQRIIASDPAALPLDRTLSIYLSGATGSGKSVLVRVLIEGAAVYVEIRILVLDPRNQSVGILLPEDRDEMLARYAEFGLQPEQARGFRFHYYAPGLGAGEPLPADLAGLGKGRNIVSFKEMDDRSRCELFARILESVFHDHSHEESDSLKTIIVVEEAHLFTKKRVSEDAKKAAEAAERELEKALREGRKYGLSVFIVSQSVRDFAYGSASIRQNTNTKIFMRNSDREVEYAADFIGDGRQIIGLRTGTAICYNAEWGAVKFKVRPPLSKVRELSAADTRRLVNPPSPSLPPALSPEASRLLGIAVQHHKQTGRPMNLAEAGHSLGTTSKRKMQELVDELERSGVVKTTKLNQRGNPRVIIPTFGPAED